MLKLIKNEVPTWTIDNSNTIFKLAKLWDYIQSIVVDGSDIWTNYSFDKNITITVDTAPATSIVVTYFSRDVSDVLWNWEVTLWDLKLQFYRKIWRLNTNSTIPDSLNRIYPESYVKSELRKSFKRITNKSPIGDRIQQYSTTFTSWAKVKSTTSNNTITLEQSITQDIEWIFYVWDWVLYDYYSISNWVYQVKGADISEIWDKILLSNKIPYWVNKITEVRVDWEELEWVNQRNFYMWNTKNYTIITDKNNNSYIFLPYSEKKQTVTIKYVPDKKYFSDDNDIIDIEEEYMDTIVYDTAYRLLLDKEDERWATFKEELWNWSKYWLLREYQSYIKSKKKSNRGRIWFSKVN
jgi:hypothetical protein